MRTARARLPERLRREPRYVRRRRTAVSVAAFVAVAAVAAIVAGGSGGGTPAATATTPAGTTSAPTRAARRHTEASAAQRVVRRGPRGTESVPILMYHVILPAPPGAPFPGLYVPKSEFAAQMRALAAAGYHAVTMDQMWDNWHDGTPLPKGKPIVVSFDNGYESQYHEAMPVLRAMGWVGVENLQLSGLPISQGGLSHGEVRALVRDGWELDTQGYDHADLITLDAAQLRFQVATARRRIRALYHVAARWFCYPSGHYDATVIAAVRAAGYLGSTTVTPGWASPSVDPYRLPRLRVLAGTTASELLAEIAAIRGNGPPGPSYG
jgi:peptidoglycan/xylan/chitin deacetylase (PgdA/CDA1 family)